MGPSKLIIYNATLNTAVFKAGRRKVANILTPILFWILMPLNGVVAISTRARADNNVYTV